jgi:hypothetical protein
MYLMYIFYITFKKYFWFSSFDLKRTWWILFPNYKKGVLDSQSQVKKLNSGRGFSPGTPASSITKTGHHDIAEMSHPAPLKNINHPFILFRFPNFWFWEYSMNFIL